MYSYFQTMGIGILILSLSFGACGAEKTSPADPPPKTEEPSEAQQTLRSYLQLQEQLHNTILAIERTRKEADAAAKANAEAIAARLEVIEQTLGSQQLHQANLL